MISFQLGNLLLDLYVLYVHLLKFLPLLAVLIPYLLNLRLFMIQTKSFLADLEI